jgi:hypothetical protein
MYPNFWSMQAPDLMSVHDGKWSRYEWRTATNDTKERPLIRSGLVNTVTVHVDFSFRLPELTRHVDLLLSCPSPITHGYLVRE